jgi:hypothetical protein
MISESKTDSTLFSFEQSIFYRHYSEDNLNDSDVEFLVQNSESDYSDNGNNPEACD